MALNYARLLQAVQFSYRKHGLGDESIGWAELEEILANTLAECMGDAFFQQWVQAPWAEREAPC